jgi:hypothetical protein
MYSALENVVHFVFTKHLRLKTHLWCQMDGGQTETSTYDTLRLGLSHNKKDATPLTSLF